MERPPLLIATRVPTMVVLSGLVRNQLYYSCEQAYPREACGALLGFADSDSVTAQITQIRCARNQAGPHRRSRYSVSPQFQFLAEREAARAGQDVVGYYHSHPDGPAVPSPCDREQAWAGYLYLICSVVKGQAVDLALYALADENSPFQRIRVEPAPASISSASEIG